MALDCRSWSDSQVPEWLLKHKDSIKGKIYYKQMTEGGRVSLVPLTNNVSMMVSYGDVGLYASMNAYVQIENKRGRYHYHDGTMLQTEVVDIFVEVSPKGFIPPKEDGQRGRFIDQDSYVLLHDGTDSLLIYAGCKLPEQEVKTKSGLLFS